MAKTYRDVAIDQMIATVVEAMSHAVDWWGNLPTPMNEAIDKFRVQLGTAIDSVEFLKKSARQASTGKRHGRPLNGDEDWLPGQQGLATSGATEDAAVGKGVSRRQT